MYWVIGEDRDGAYTGSTQNLGNFALFYPLGLKLSEQMVLISRGKIAKNGKTFALVH